MMIWNISDIVNGEVYVLGLCHSSEGVRYFQLLKSGTPKSDNTIFLTKDIPLDLLMKRDLISISEQIPLADGQRFYVDAHGIWFSESEVSQRSRGLDFYQVQWATPTEPKLPSA